MELQESHVSSTNRNHSCSEIMGDSPLQGECEKTKITE